MSEREEPEMVERAGEHHTEHHGHEVAAAAHQQGEDERVGRAWGPLPHDVGVERSRQGVPVERDAAHHRECGEREHPPGAGKEPARDRVRDEAKEVRHAQAPDSEEEQPREQAGEDEQRHHGHEGGLARRVDGGCRDRNAERPEHGGRHLLGHREHAPVAARGANKQAKDDAAEEHHAGALHRKGQKRSAEHDGRERDAVNDDHRAHEPPDGQRAQHLGRREVGAKLRKYAHAPLGRCAITGLRNAGSRPARPVAMVRKMSMSCSLGSWLPNTHKFVAPSKNCPSARRATWVRTGAGGPARMLYGVNVATTVGLRDRALLGVPVQGSGRLREGAESYAKRPNAWNGAPDRIWWDRIGEDGTCELGIAIGERRNDGHEKGSACGDLAGEAGDAFVQSRVLVQAVCLRRSRARS